MTNYAEALAAAHHAAAKAQEGMVENPFAFDCGFAWVTLSGNDPFARWCRKQATAPGALPAARRIYGSKGFPSGWQFWCPGPFGGQSVGIHEAGAKAFRDKLGEFGIRADMGSRLD